MYDYSSRRPLVPELGRIYDNQGGGRYQVLQILGEHEARVVNLASGWCCTAHGLGQYFDGTIDWDYSTGGYYIALDCARNQRVYDAVLAY